MQQDSCKSPNLSVNLESDRRDELCMKMMADLCSGYSRPHYATNSQYDISHPNSLGLTHFHNTDGSLAYLDCSSLSRERKTYYWAIKGGSANPPHAKILHLKVTLGSCSHSQEILGYYFCALRENRAVVDGETLAVVLHSLCSSWLHTAFTRRGLFQVFADFLSQENPLLVLHCSCCQCGERRPWENSSDPRNGSSTLGVNSLCYEMLRCIWQHPKLSPDERKWF